jgi:hypothetical protein
MARANAAVSAQSEFDAFLYSAVAEENDGMLSMLSALARLDVDPWEEAARLARLPRVAAQRFLTSMIAALPQGGVARGDPGAVAERLVALLPQRVAPRPAPGTTPALASGIGIASARPGIPRYLVFYFVMMALLFLGQWVLHSNAPPAKPAVAPAAAAALPSLGTVAPAPAVIAPPP